MKHRDIFLENTDLEEWFLSWFLPEKYILIQTDFCSLLKIKTPCKSLHSLGMWAAGKYFVVGPRQPDRKSVSFGWKGSNMESSSRKSAYQVSMMGQERINLYEGWGIFHDLTATGIKMTSLWLYLLPDVKFQRGIRASDVSRQFNEFWKNEERRKEINFFITTKVKRLEIKLLIKLHFPFEGFAASEVNHDPIRRLLSGALESEKISFYLD